MRGVNNKDIHALNHIIQLLMEVCGKSILIRISSYLINIVLNMMNGVPSQLHQILVRTMCIFSLRT